MLKIRRVVSIRQMRSQGLSIVLSFSYQTYAQNAACDKSN